MPRGTIEITWGLDQAAGNPQFTLSWVEAGGPREIPPEPSGFGTTIIEAMPRMELDAEVALVYAREGICWRLRCPTERVLAFPLGFEASSERKP
jgi:two-component sensor histidine kinase